MSMPVPRRMPSRPAETVMPDYEQYGNVGPDSGFAMKIVNKDSVLWSSHPKKKLVSTIIVNLILFMIFLYNINQILRHLLHKKLNYFFCL